MANKVPNWIEKKKSWNKRAMWNANLLFYNIETYTTSYELPTSLQKCEIVANENVYFHAFYTIWLTALLEMTHRDLVHMMLTLILCFLHRSHLIFHVKHTWCCCLLGNQTYRILINRITDKVVGCGGNYYSYSYSYFK